MAVFTTISESEMNALLSRYDIGDLVSLREVGQGIENSNYFLTTTVPKAQESNVANQQWVVTVYETLAAPEIPFFLGVTATLADAGLPVPAAVADMSGHYLQTLKSKPLAIFPRFAGDWRRAPTKENRAAVADFIATMHQVALPVTLQRQQPRDFRWMRAQQQKLQNKASADDLKLIAAAMQLLEAADGDLKACPRGIVHGDLFRDNVLFAEERLSGVIDFYHACEDLKLFDLAVAVNDWCAEPSGEIRWDSAEAMLAVYRQQRPLELQEETLWGHILLLAALRFWLSRLVSRHHKSYQSEATQGDITKDPDEFKRKVCSIAAYFGFSLNH